MKKIAYLTITGILIVYIIAVYIAYYIMLPNYVFNLLTTNTKITLERGNIKTKHSLLPTVTIDDLLIKDILSIKNTNICFSLPSLFIFSPKISSIEIKESNIGLNNVYNNDIFAYLNQIPNIEKCNIKLKNIQFTDANNEPVYYIYDAMLTLSNGNIYILKARVNNQQNLDALLTFDHQLHIDLQLLSNYHKLEFTGILSPAVQLLGKYKISINNFGEYIKNNYADIDLISTSFKNDDKAVITFDINPIDEGGISVDNINIDADFAQGTGNLIIEKSYTKPNIINLRFKTLKLDKLFDVQNSSIINNSNINADGSYLRSKIKMPIHNSNVIINCDETQWKNERFTRVAINGVIQDSSLHLDNVIGTIESGGSFKLTGTVEQNQYRSIFKGMAELQHQNVNMLLSNLGHSTLAAKTLQPVSLSADLKLTPVSYYAENINMSIGDGDIRGYIHIRNGDKYDKILTQLVLTNIDLTRDEYPGITAMWKSYKDMINIVSEDDYLTRFVKLNNLGYVAYLNLNCKSITFTNQRLPSKVNLVLNLAPGKVKIDNIYYHNDQNKFIGQSQLFTNTITPNFDVKINQGRFNLNGQEEQIFEHLRSLINSLKYKRFTLSFSANLEKLLINNNQYNDFAIKLSNSSDFINVDNISMRTANNNGEIVAKGNILIDPLSSTFVYAYNSFYIPDYSFILSDNRYSLPKGVASMNGKLNTSGDTIKEIKHNINVNGEFIAKDVDLENIDLETVVMKLVQQNYNNSDLSSGINLDNTDNKTVIKNAKGKFSFSNGILKFNDCEINNELLYGNTNGIVDLNKKTINFIAKLNVSDKNDKNTKYLISNNLANLDVYIYGPYNDKITRMVKFNNQSRR